MIIPMLIVGLELFILLSHLKETLQLCLMETELIMVGLCILMATLLSHLKEA